MEHRPSYATFLPIIATPSYGIAATRQERFGLLIRNASHSLVTSDMLHSPAAPATMSRPPTSVSSSSALPAADHVVTPFL